MIDEAARESAERRGVTARESEKALNALTRQPVGTTPVAVVLDEPGDELPAEPNQLNAYDSDLMSQMVDWSQFWDLDTSDAQWLAEPILAEGRAHAIYAPGGTGKSLFSLWMAAALATGRQGLDGEPLQRRRVLYLDYEMSHADVLERLEAMGYDRTCDMSWLHYALLPTVPPADAPEGGKAIARMAQLVDAELVVLDTFSRAVSGDENDADTVRAFYRWTLLHIKADGRTFVRIDHAGKDIEKGQRGTSAKNDDVDVVWQMTKADGGFKLTAKKRRMGWVDEHIALQQYDSPNLHYKVADYVAPAGTDRVVADLDDLNVPADASQRRAIQVLKDAGRPCRAEVVRAAQKKRSRRSFSLDLGRDAPRDADKLHTSGTHSQRAGTHPQETDSDQALHTGTHFGTHRDAPPGANGDASPSLMGDAPPANPSGPPDW
jgi:hypothetical protein